eukprot:162060-Pyramimonas_sp.AAC.1
MLSELARGVCGGPHAGGRHEPDESRDGHTTSYQKRKIYCVSLHIGPYGWRFCRRPRAHGRLEPVEAGACGGWSLWGLEPVGAGA